MQILLLIFLFLFFGILIIFSVFRKIVSFFFGGLFGKGFSGQNQQQSGNFKSSSEQTGKQQSNKIFSKDEGEYVGFEEIE